MAIADLYWPLIEYVASILTADMAFTGVKQVIRPEPVYVTGDVLPLLIVSPDMRTWEKVTGERFENQADLEYPVVITYAVQNTFDQVQVEAVLQARRTISADLWSVGTLVAFNETNNCNIYDADYDPAPQGIGVHGFTREMAVSLQLFRYKHSAQRANVS